MFDASWRRPVEPTEAARAEADDALAPGSLMNVFLNVPALRPTSPGASPVLTFPPHENLFVVVTAASGSLRPCRSANIFAPFFEPNFFCSWFRNRAWAVSLPPPSPKNWDLTAFKA